MHTQLDEGDKLLEVGENKFLSQVDTIVDACGRRSRLHEKFDRAKAARAKLLRQQAAAAVRAQQQPVDQVVGTQEVGLAAHVVEH